MTERRRPLLGTRGLIVLASLLLLLSILATWIRAQIIDTSGWTQTSVRLLRDDRVRGELSSVLSERLLSVADVRKLAADNLPKALAPLAGALSGTAPEALPPAIDRALRTPLAEQAWARANLAAHAQVIELLDGGGAALSTRGGVVSLDVRVLLDELGRRLGLGSGVGGGLPLSQRRIVLLHSNQLHAAQGAVRGLRGLSVALPVLTLLAYLGALLMAAGRRRRALLEIGTGMVLAALGSHALRAYAESYATNNLLPGEAHRPAVHQVFAILTGGWQSRALWLTGLGVLLVLLALLLRLRAPRLRARGARAASSAG
jgi:hypothetical protein